MSVRTQITEFGVAVENDDLLTLSLEKEKKLKVATASLNETLKKGSPQKSLVSFFRVIIRIVFAVSV